jgi:hypothetical protein
VTPSHVAPDPFDMDDAAYLLGALSPHDRVRYEQHLQTCDTCRSSLTELAGLPGVLRRLPLEVVLAMDQPEHDDVAGADPEPPPSVLSGLLARVEGEEHRHRRVKAVRWAGALTTAAAALVVAALAMGWWGPEEPPPVANPSPQEQLSLEPVADTEVTANVSLQEVGWGTKIQLECNFPAPPGVDPYAAAPEFSLVVHDAEGESDQVATWNALAGKEFIIDAATALKGPDIASIEVRAQDGTPVLRTEG